MSTICTKCNQEVTDDEGGVSCTFCHSWHHPSCMGISSKQYKLLTEIENCLWFCDAHKARIHDLFLEKTPNSAEISKDVKDIKEEINKLSSSITKHSFGSYADALRSNNSALRSNNTVSRITTQKQQPTNGVIVSSTLPNISSEYIEKKIKEKINLVQTKSRISKLKHISKDRVFLGTLSSSDSTNLEKLIVEKLGPDFSATQPKKIHPQLIISNIEREYNEEELWEEIQTTNSGFTNEDRIKLVHTKNFKNQQGLTTFAFIIQAIPSTFEKLVNRYINVNFNARFVREHITATRCFNCQSYGHRGANCTSPSICSRCAANHKTSECKKKTSTFSCFNCLEHNRKSSTKVSTNHSCGGAQCHMQQLKVDNLKMKISYDCCPVW